MLSQPTTRQTAISFALLRDVRDLGFNFVDARLVSQGFDLRRPILQRDEPENRCRRYQQAVWEPVKVTSAWHAGRPLPVQGGEARTVPRVLANERGQVEVPGQIVGHFSLPRSFRGAAGPPTLVAAGRELLWVGKEYTSVRLDGPDGFFTDPRTLNQEGFWRFNFKSIPDVLAVPDAVSLDEVARWEWVRWSDPDVESSLIYADWCEENGWQSRAEGLRKAMRRAAPAPDRR